MARFLMWNVNRKSLDGHIVALVKDHEVDFVLVIERPENDRTLALALGGARGFVKVSSSDRFGFYARPQEAERLLTPGNSDRVNYWRVRLTADADILAVGVHGPDRRNWEDGDRALFFQRMAAEIAWLEEKRVCHRRTVIAGDFNANPYEPAMTSIFGLHALPITSLSGRTWRQVNRVRYPFFYNPMWAHYGDGVRAPRGSYYWSRSGATEVFWHLIDQVVLRPDAVEWFPENRLQVVSTAGAATLLTTTGLPNQDSASDHLPILFEVRPPAEA